MNKRILSRKQDLCQLVKDMVSVSEATNWNARSSVESKYKALRCHIEYVDDDIEDLLGVIDADGSP